METTKPDIGSKPRRDPGENATLGIDFAEVEIHVLAGRHSEALKLIANWVRYTAWSIVRKAPTLIDVDDLTQAGMIAAWNMMSTWDTSKDISWSTYAATRIRGAMLDHMRSMDFTTRQVRKHQAQIMHTSDALTTTNGRRPTPAEVRTELGITIDQYYLAQIASSKYVDVHGGSEETMQLAGKDEMSMDPMQRVSIRQSAQLAHAFLSALGDRDRRVIEGFYDNDETLSDIGDEMGYSKGRTSQILCDVLERLQDAMDIRDMSVREHARVRQEKMTYKPLSKSGCRGLEKLLDDVEFYIRFNDGQARVKEFKYPYVHVVIRIGYTSHGVNTAWPSIAMPSIWVPTSRQNQGIATKVLDRLEIIAQKMGKLFVIDNVINPNFAAKIRERATYVEESRPNNAWGSTTVSFFKTPSGNTANSGDSVTVVDF